MDMTKSKRLAVTYRPDELKAAIAMLQNNSYHCFEVGDATGIVYALFSKGFRIIHTGILVMVMDKMNTRKTTVPAAEAARIYDNVARNWREATKILNAVNGTHFTVDGVQQAVRKLHEQRDDRFRDVGNSGRVSYPQRRCGNV